MDTNLLPRLIRLKNIPQYLGMDRRIFNKLIRPHLIEIPVGTHGKAFDRLEIDNWIDQYKKSKGVKLWDVKECLDSLKEEKSGMLINRFSDKEFEKVLTLSRSKKQKDI